MAPFGGLQLTDPEIEEPTDFIGCVHVHDYETDDCVFFGAILTAHASVCGPDMEYADQALAWAAELSRTWHDYPPLRAPMKS